MNYPCCDTMAYWSSNHCPVHDSPFECPDWLIVHEEKGRSEERYGIVIHDGGSSYVTIRYCPWCGSRLSSSD